MRHRCAGLLTLCAALYAGQGVALAQDDVELGAQVRAGVEYDDNALRVPLANAPAGDALARYFLALDASSGPLALTLRHGGKVFASESGADTLLTQAALSWRRRLGEVGFALTLDVKDRTEREPRLDYTRGGVTARLSLRPLESLGLSASGGWRFFAYKPNSATSSSGAFGSLGASWFFADAWSANLAYSIFSRGFESPTFELADGSSSTVDFMLVQGDVLRSDVFHVARASVGWRGPVVLDAGYSLSLNRSNSYGQDLARHTVDASVTAPLPFELFVSLRGQLQRTNYDDPVLIDADFSIDEDNRNALVASVSRAFGDSWDVEMRYSVYVQEFGAGSEYQRQTFLVALGYTYENE